MTRLGASVLEDLLAADAGYAGPRLDCGAGHRAELAGYRGKTVDTVLGPVAVGRAWYHCRECGHGFAPRDDQLQIAGQGMSPGLRKMTARAAAAVPFAQASTLLRELAGVRVTAKRAGRRAEADGRAAAARIEADAEAIAARRLAVLPPAEPLPGKLYVAIDGTGVPMTAAETDGRAGKGEDGKARTREVKMAAVFTQATVDADGYPVRDPDSSSYLATLAPAPGFGILMAAEARRRGAGHIRQLTILGDGAPLDLEPRQPALPRRHPDCRPVPRPRARPRASEPRCPAAGRPRDEWLAERLADLDAGDTGALLAAGRDLKFTGSLASVTRPCTTSRPTPPACTTPGTAPSGCSSAPASCAPDTGQAVRGGKQG